MKYRYCYHCGNATTEIREGANPRSYCPHCRLILYENPLPSVAAVVTDTTGAILLIKRKYEPGAGGWCLPGGFIEVGETPAQAILREVWEETGIKGQEPQLFGVGTHLNGFYGDILIIAYALEVNEQKVVPQDDAAEAGFFTWDQRPRLVFPVHEELLAQYINWRKRP